jgi:hypothetical protein
MGLDVIGCDEAVSGDSDRSGDQLSDNWISGREMVKVIPRSQLSIPVQ